MKVIEWKPIKGFDGYFINELGEVKSTRTFKETKEKILKSHKNQQGYLVYTLMKFGKPYYSVGNIVECCNCKRKTAYGFIWRYVKDE